MNAIQGWSFCFAVVLTLLVIGGGAVVAAHDAFRRWLAHRDSASRVVAAYEKSYQEARAELAALRSEMQGRVAELEKLAHGGLGGARGRSSLGRVEVRG